MMQTFVSFCAFVNILLFCTSDGNQDEKDIRGWAVSSYNHRGRQELLRAVRPGKFQLLLP